MSDFLFPEIGFSGELRPSQKDVMAVVEKGLAAGKKRYYIVAPPGSGKTVTGLYLWTRLVRRPALVLSPNSAIQAQWANRAGLFAAGEGAFSMDPEAPGLLTSLTYQAVTMPKRGGGDLDGRAREIWIELLMAKGQAKDPEEAEAWIESLRENNPGYFEERLSVYRKEVRDGEALSGKGLTILHDSALALIDRLKAAGVGMIILDECHHLMGHWGRVLKEVAEYFDGPVVVGLTATPPDPSGKRPEDVKRFGEFFGPLDYEVPVPAVVKDGFLAPFQDLAYFVRPDDKELAFIAQADQAFLDLVEELAAMAPAAEGGPQPLVTWLSQSLAEHRIGQQVHRDHAAFDKRDPEFSLAARVFLRRRAIQLPLGVPGPGAAGIEAMGNLETVIPVLDRYVRHHLRMTPDPRAHELAEKIVSRLRVLGVQITETGSQACASPVSRVLSYSRNKARALSVILKTEMEALGDDIRAVIITDYEKTSATTAEVGGLLDEEAGGAVAAFRALLDDPGTDALDPVLVTGSTVLVDDDLAPRFLEESRRWLREKGCEVELAYEDAGVFRNLIGRGPDWSPRVYVTLITELFQRGLTRCLVGTRGLLGEGWDAVKINVLIDLTTVAASMTVNQVRGRSIRLDPDDPEKLADNWDVVAIAPEFIKGLDDYRRFVRKHETAFGITDDGVIEKGPGHVHAAFTELEPEGVEDAANLLNDHMLKRPALRQEVYAKWRIGEPYHPEPVKALEIKAGGGGGGFPPFGKSAEPWAEDSLTLAVAEAVRGALLEARLIEGGPVRHGERAGGYLRVFLEGGDEESRALFADSLREALSPLDRPRYVIPRYVDMVRRRWLSKVLPEVLDRYLGNRGRKLAMIHAVPSELSRQKDLAAVYTRHWNRHVSPGEAVYAFQGEGERMVEDAVRRGAMPQGKIHGKEIFL